MPYGYRFNNFEKSVEITSKDPQDIFFALKHLITDEFINPDDYLKVDFILEDNEEEPKIIFTRKNIDYSSTYEKVILKNVWIGNTNKYYVDNDPNYLLPTVYSYHEYVLKILKLMHFKIMNIYKKFLDSFEIPKIDFKEVGYYDSKTNSNFEDEKSYHIIIDKSGYFFFSSKNAEMFIEDKLFQNIIEEFE